MTRLAASSTQCILWISAKVPSGSRLARASNHRCRTRGSSTNSISVNKDKVGEDRTVGEADLLTGGLVLLQRGKKNYFLVKVVD